MRARGSIELLQLDPFVVLLENLFIRRAVERHAERADLAHAHAVTPAAAEERHADHVAGGIALDVEREQAVAETEQGAEAQRGNRPAPARADNLSGDLALREAALENAHVGELTN